MAIKHNPVETFNRIKALPDLPPFVLLLCSDLVRKNRIADTLLQKFFPAKNGEPGYAASTGLCRIDAAVLNKDGLAELSEKVISPSLFSAHQLFLIRNIDELNTGLNKSFIKLLESLPPGINFILSGKSLPASNPLVSFFALRDLLVELPDLKGQELRRWTEKELRTAGIKSVNTPVTDALIKLAESSPDRIVQLVEHAALYCEDGKLELQTIRTLFAEHVEPEEFALIDAISDRNPSRPELLLNQLMASGKSAFPILAIISRVFSNYLLIKHLAIRGRTPNDIRQELKMTSWVFGKSQTAAKRYSLTHLVVCFKHVLRADSLLKNRSLGQGAVLSDLISRLRT